jgi:hypothetical protein
MIKIVKLITGEDVVADIEILEDKVVMKNPQRFIMTQEGLGSIPLLPFSSDEKISVNMNHVVLIAEPDSEVKNGYNAQHGSGIVVASSSKILKA